MFDLVRVLLSLHPALVLVAVSVLPAVESSALVGLVVPGETAVFVGGLVAHAGGLPLWAVMVAAAFGAIVGDQIGFRLGRRWGPGLLKRLPGRLRDSSRLDRVTRLVRKRGAWAVAAGRWTALLRALVPGLAGASGMRQREFTMANLAGGVSWAVAVSALGYGAGAAYQQILQSVHQGTEVVLVAGVAIVLVSVLVRRLSRGREDRRTRGSVGAAAP
jgi:membrane-associated protein